MEKMTNEQIRNNIRNVLIDLRHEKGVTQKDVSQFVGLSESAVSSWEKGLSLPDIATLYRLSLYYQKSLEYMYGIKKENPRPKPKPKEIDEIMNDPKFKQAIEKALADM